VLFLTQGQQTKYDDYRDPRTWSIMLASKFVEMAEILGVNAFSEDVLRDITQVDLVKGRGQILFVWMDEKDSEKGTVQYLKERGVDGIVYDRWEGIIFPFSAFC
jgi:glycerophosphoryl diester phosphodiesterase